ncbi:putative transaminase [Helianthus anomalus]
MEIVCASRKAIEASQNAKSLRFVFFLKDYRKFYKMGTYWTYTTSIQLLYGLKAFLNLIFEEGLDNVIARHTRISTITRSTTPTLIDSPHFTSFNFHTFTLAG